MMVSNGDVACETPSLPKMNFMELSGLAEQFVMQYYSVMNKCPDLLHRFYGNDSTLIYESSPICGQADIHNAFCKLNLNDTRTTILKIDALKAFQNSALVQVSGEISVSNGPYRRFMRSFTLLEKNPSDFYVLTDIFRYQDRVYISEKNEAKAISGHPSAEVKERSKPAEEKPVAKTSANGVVHEQKRHNHEKKQEISQSAPKESEPRKAEGSRPARTPTPKVAAEPAPQLETEKQSPAQIVQAQTRPSSLQTPSQPAVQANQKQQQQQQSPQQPAAQQPVSNVQMSWAQRASANGPITAPVSATSVVHRPQTQSVKSVSAENQVPNAPTQRGGQLKRMSGGGRPHQGDVHRDSLGDRNDTQAQPRGGFTQQGVARGNMRGGGSVRGNRGSGGPGRGGSNRGAGNPSTPRR